MRKRYGVFVIILCLIFFAFGFLFYWKFRNSTVIKPGRDFENKNVVYYFQKADSWKNDYLGESKYQMGDSGCLTTCIASILQMQGIDSRIDPGTLNQLFSQESVYDAQGNILWDALELALDVSVERRDAFSSSEIENLLETGIYPVVRVRVNGWGNFHYVVLTGAGEGSFLCMDPLKNREETLPLSEFGNRIYAVRYISRK